MERRRKRLSIWKRVIALALGCCMIGGALIPERVQAETVSEEVREKLENFSISVQNVVLLDTSEFTSDITWKSSNPAVAYVVENHLFALGKGTAEITASSKNLTKKFKVKVTCEYKEKITLNSQKLTLCPKETFQLWCGNAGSSIKWSSSDSKVATVTKSGMVKGIKRGTATITVKTAGQKLTCKVRVIGNNDYTKIKQTYGYSQKQVSKKPTVIETDRFVLIIDKGIYVPKDIKKRMNKIMDTVEKETGLTFAAKKSKFTRSTDKVVINIKNSRYGEAWNWGGNFTCISSYDAALETYGEEAIIHELSHEIQKRNYGNIGVCLTEGFAVYYTDKVLHSLGSNFRKDMTYNHSSPWLKKMNAKNVEPILLNPEDPHDSSYFFFKYLIKTYGKSKMKKIYKDIVTSSFTAGKSKGEVDCDQLNLSDKKILSIIKKDTDEKVPQKFVRWMKKQYRNENIIYDYTDVAKIDFSPQYASWGDGYENAVYNYKDSITMDLSRGIEFEDKIVGKKYWGMCGSVQGNGSMIFYNSSGKVLKTIRLNSKATRFEVKGATKLKLSGGNKAEIFFYNEHIFK